jgi:hypothetical protein
MGWVNTRIILGILYFGLITPMGVDDADVWLGFYAQNAKPRCCELSSRAAGEATHTI